MPSTLPSKVPVARKDRRYGIRIEKMSSVPSGVPIVKTEKEAGCSVSQSASAAAIFIGCCSVMILPWMSPVIATSRPDTRSMTAPGLGRRAERRGDIGAVTVLEHPVHPDPRDEGASRHERGRDRVGERDQRRAVGQEREEVRELGATRDGVVLVAHRVLHPGVGGQDEVGGQDRADGRDPDRGQVDPGRKAAPAEDPEAQERGLQEEGQQALDGQRGAEDVAHEPAVAAPVHPELELLDDAGDEAQGEVDQEQLTEEPGQPEVLLVLRAVPGGLEPRDRERESDGQRDEQEVVDGGDAELPPREHQRIHERATPPWDARPVAGVCLGHPSH